MSSGIEIVRKIRAFQEGKPLSRRKMKSVALIEPEKTIFISFVRMGGEALPWGIAWGHPGDKPKLAIVSDPWVRDDLADTLKEFENGLAQIIGHPSSENKTKNPKFQIFLPNGSHLEMLQNIAFRYMFATRGELEHKETLNRLGRICNFLFQESQRPGQQVVHVMSEVLKEHFTFPADDLRQGHLGFLMALLNTKGDLNARLAAGKLAEKKTVGISLSPELEKDVLENDIKELRIATRAEKSDEIKKLKDKIQTEIEKELVERNEVLKNAFIAFREDKRVVNPGALKLLDRSLSEIGKYYAQEEKKFEGSEEKSFFAGPKTDYDEISAAINYNIYQADEETMIHALSCHDETLQDELIASGDALYGLVKKVEVREEITEKKRKIEIIIWMIECSNSIPMRLREGSKVSPISNSHLSGEIVKIEIVGDKRIIEIEMEPKKASKEFEIEGKAETFIQTAFSSGMLPLKIKMYTSQRQARKVS